MKLFHFLQLAALLHLVLLSAGLTMPKAIRLKEQFARLDVFPRHLFWVYYTFIGFIILSFGVLTWLFAVPMAHGEPMGRAMCIVMGMFWILRMVAAAGFLNTRQFLTNSFYRLGNAALNLVFIYLACVYTWAALKGTQP